MKISHFVAANGRAFLRCVVCSFVLFTAASCAATAAAGTPSTLAELDALVKQQRYDTVLQRLRDSSITDEEKFDWLRGHAEAGHVPLQYELAALIFPRDRAESLKWYARGRLARTLDAAECTRPTGSFGGRVGLDNRAAMVRDAGVADSKAFNRAIEEALDWDAARRSAPPATWICGEAISSAGGPLKPEPERRAARDEARQNMRIAAKTISDFERAVELGAQANFKVLESGILVEPPYRRWAGWVDNRRLLFVGFPPGTIDLHSIPDKSTGAVILLWDTEQNRIETFLRPPFINELCVDDGHVVIVTEADDRSVVVFEGQFPKLSPRSVERSTKVLSPVRADCKPPHPIVGPRNTFDDLWLREGHGYIERPTEPVPAGGGYPFVRFHRSDGTELPLPVTPQGAWLLAYAPWRGAYLLQGESRAPRASVFRLPGDRRRGDDAVLFWLYPDGRTEPIVVQYGQWDMANRPSAFYRPTARGLVLAGGYSDNDNEPGFSGLYLFRGNGEVTRLVAGPANVAAISPNGCHVAFAHAPTAAGLRYHVGLPTDPTTRQAMKVVDVCTSD